MRQNAVSVYNPPPAQPRIQRNAMNPKMFVQPAIRISLIAAVITGILILFGVRWWVALLSVLLAAALIALAAVWAVKRQRKQFTDRLKSFNIDPQSGRINPAGPAAACTTAAARRRKTPCSSTAWPTTTARPKKRTNSSKTPPIQRQNPSGANQSDAGNAGAAAQRKRQGQGQPLPLNSAGCLNTGSEPVFRRPQTKSTHRRPCTT